MFAPSKARHPYLIYSALLTAPLYFQLPKISLNSLNKYILHQQKVTSTITSTEKNKSSTKSQQQEPERSELDNSVYANIPNGPSLHSDSVLTPSTTTSDDSAPTPTSAESRSSLPFTATTSALVHKLYTVHHISSSLSGLAFLISTVGIYGDFA